MGPHQDWQTHQELTDRVKVRVTESGIGEILFGSRCWGRIEWLDVGDGVTAKTTCGCFSSGHDDASIYACLCEGTNEGIGFDRNPERGRG